MYDLAFCVLRAQGKQLLFVSPFFPAVPWRQANQITFSTISPPSLVVFVPTQSSNLLCLQNLLKSVCASTKKRVASRFILVKSFMLTGSGGAE